METNVSRKLLFDQLLKVPHRDYSTVVPSFLDGLNTDPDFTSKAMVYLYTTSAIRDQQDAAIITLLQSTPSLGLRDAGRAMFGLDFYNTANTEGFKALPPYRLLRIWQYIRNSPLKTRRQLTKLMNDWLDKLEKQQDRFDNLVLLNRKEMSNLYVYLHRHPPVRYQVWLGLQKKFGEVDELPSGSIFEAVNLIGKTADPIEKARLVMQYKVPYTIASSLLPKKNAAAHVALIEAMSPTEAMNSVSWVEQSGILEIAEVNKAFLAKLALAKDVTSMKHRQSSKAKTAGVAAVIEAAKDTAVAQAKKITLPTLVIIDRSASMRLPLEVSKEFAVFLGSRLESTELLYMIAVNDGATRIRPRSLSMSDVEAATRNIKDNGATCLGVGLREALNDGFEPQQVVILTDGYENRSPSYLSVLEKNEDMQTIIIGFPGSEGPYRHAFHQPMEARGFPVTFLPYTASGRNDYYLFEQVASILSGQGKKSLVQTIMDIELPYIL